METCRKAGYNKPPSQGPMLVMLPAELSTWNQTSGQCPLPHTPCDLLPPCLVPWGLPTVAHGSVADSRLQPRGLPVDGIQHLNDNQRGQRHGRRLGVAEDSAVQPLEVVVLHEALALMGLQARHTHHHPASPCTHQPY